MPGKHAPAHERFWRHVNKTDDCWLWTGSINDSGYGQFKVDRRPVKASRFSWCLHFGAIPPGMLVCHHCDNPPCVRPDHLFLGSDADNTADMIAKGRGAINQPGKNCVKVLVEQNRRLDDTMIAEARRRASIGESSRSIARELGCSHTTISRLINGTHWSENAHTAIREAC